ncbi:MAG: Rne/Rng family ribonuclease [Arenicellales bacterium]|jgi:ribonuclease E|nr:Rne/Rng family ribonuclease [Arenicellales bacterium]
MKRMLFNATHAEELRVAIVDGQKLIDLDIESALHSQRKGNIYQGRVTRVEPSLEAAFVDYGAERQGFLPLKEISRSDFRNFSPATPMAQVRIKDVIEEGQELLVQVEKDERGTKGAALTTFISLAGRYLVLMPNNPKGGGISRRIDGPERADLRDAMMGLEVPTEHSLIARTAGIGKTPEELQWDLNFLMQLWGVIEEATSSKSPPFLVYQESNLIVRTIRDHLRTDIQEILVDEPSVFDRASRFMEQVMPQNASKLKLYEDSVPLFSRFQIEHQIENAYARTVKLPSGGALVIDHTEALISIDVNSARATKGSDIEETALQTNLEAVDELARQMRIRDLGGLLVIDLIDMTSARNKKTVETRLEEAVHNDRARIQIGHISRFGLLEMSRQRLRSSISESNYGVCPLCDGTGQVRHVTSSALSFLRILEEEALKENTEAVLAELPVDIATFLLNEKRHEVNQVESRLGTRIVLIPSPDLQGSQFNIQRLRSEDIDATGNTLESHKIRIIPASENELEYSLTHRKTRPAVNLDQIDTPPPPVPSSAQDRSKPGGLGLLKRIWNRLTKGVETPEPEKKPERPAQRGGRSGQSRSRGRRSGGRRDGQRQERKEGSEGGRNRNAQRQGNAGRNRQSSADNSSSSASGQKSGQRRSRGGRGRSGGQGSRPNSGDQQQDRASKSSTNSAPAPAAVESSKTGTED